jgi:Methyltransferase domain
VRSGPADPIPDRRSLGDLERRVSDLHGVDMRESAQLDLLDKLAPYRSEIAELGIQPGFGALDVEVLYGMVRRFSPRLFIEVKSGVSTLVTARAMAANEEDGGAAGTINVLDPNATPEIAEDARIAVRREDITKVPVDMFRQLARDDVLFVDTSHVLKTGSDVQYLFLDVLPQIPVGTLVHVHDVFLPREYPMSWLTDLRFANEQYVLQAFLAFNDSFEVVWSSAYMHHRHSERLAALFHSYDAAASRQGASFWMRRLR